MNLTESQPSSAAKLGSEEANLAFEKTNIAITKRMLRWDDAWDEKPLTNWPNHFLNGKHPWWVTNDWPRRAKEFEATDDCPKDW
jgi:hypothetical protein